MGHIIHSIVQYPRPLYKKVYLVIISAVTLRIVKFTLRLVKLTDFTNNPINNLIVEYLYIYITYSWQESIITVSTLRN